MNSDMPPFLDDLLKGKHAHPPADPFEELHKLQAALSAIPEPDKSGKTVQEKPK